MIKNASIDLSDYTPLSGEDHVLLVPARCEAFMCYGPLVPDGYGCCYNPRSASIVFGVSALNSSPETHSSTFRDALEASLTQMRELLELPDDAA
ncbi:hypothetical protein HAZT_HAZT010618 [Hyalella azteca]|uniref:Choline/carnitine acyltransferase domain-containing protein n=1 Tax=Hyalella azteca TaxID=294128 RepID=A0A6A0HD07_HYAAZ|nr:hypothetical protein HAZT_HAZT010618 [Hyalella azteca]